MESELWPSESRYVIPRVVRTAVLNSNPVIPQDGTGAAESTGSSATSKSQKEKWFGLVASGCQHQRHRADIAKMPLAADAADRDRMTRHITNPTHQTTTISRR